MVKNRNRILLFLSLALAITLAGSCEKKDLQEPVSEAASTENNIRSANLLYEEDMEGPELFPTAHAIESCSTSWTLSYVTNPVFQGANAARFEIRKDQPRVGTSQSIRSEVTIIKGTEYPNFPRDVWYSFALLIPSVGFEYDDTRDCINQWYEDGSNETTIRVHKDKAFLEVTPAKRSSILMKYDLFGTTSSTKILDGFTNIPKDEWHYFVFHFIHSKDSDGLIEVWRDGVKIHTILGRNMHLELPKWKIGVYKSAFQDSSSIHYSRVIYYDNVRVGNSNATLAEMMGDTIITSPPPVFAGVESFTLVNALTEQDIMPLTDGAVINRKALGITKFNIRANTEAGSGPVVKFIMSGTVSKTTLDDTVPYAMFGDKSGNYNTWTAQAGTYRLEANTYSGTKSNPSAATGAPYVINFTVQ